MEKEKNENASGGGAVGDSVLAFLAKCHPGDENSLESMTVLLGSVGGLDDERLLEAVYKGMRYDRDVEDAREQGRIAGRNEKIENEMRRKAETVPADDGGLESNPDDLPLLRHIRRSVWDD